MALSDYQTLVQRLVRDQSTQVTSPDVDRVIASAVRRYGDDAPRRLVRDVTWTTAGYVGPAPAELVAESLVLAAEWPIGQVPAAVLALSIVISPPEALGLVADELLPAGAVVRVTFTAPHVLSSSPAADTIPLMHRDAVAAYAAHLLCTELATYYSGERESSIGADGSNTESRARNYAARARDYRAQYYGTLGIADPIAAAGRGGSGTAAGVPVPAASAVTSWPRRRGWLRSGDTVG